MLSIRLSRSIEIERNICGVYMSFPRAMDWRTSRRRRAEVETFFGDQIFLLEVSGVLLL